MEDIKNPEVISKTKQSYIDIDRHREDEFLNNFRPVPYDECRSILNRLMKKEYLFNEEKDIINKLDMYIENLDENDKKLMDGFKNNDDNFIYYGVYLYLYSSIYAYITCEDENVMELQEFINNLIENIKDEKLHEEMKKLWTLYILKLIDYYTEQEEKEELKIEQKQDNIEDNIKTQKNINVYFD